MNETPETLIVAGQGEAHYWRDLWRYRELLGFLAWRDIKVRYKQAVLGFLWALVQPLVQTILLTFVFGRLAKMPSGGIPYGLLVLSGILPWQLFASAFNGSGNSLVSNSNLISKVYFPRLIIPISSLAVALVDLVLPLAITFPCMWYFGIYPSWRLLLLPVFTLDALFVALSAGLWITALTVRYRDFRFIAPFMLQVGMLVSPVGFRADFLHSWKPLLSINPMMGVIEGFRWSLLGSRSNLDATSVVVSLAITVLLLASGLWYFRKTERQFADII